MSDKKPSVDANDPSQPEDAALIADARRQAAALDDSDLTLDAPPGGNGFIGPPPDSFTGYRIIKEVHRGGQGVVYQAIQESTSREVAIKVMRQGPFADSSDRARFDREVQVLGQLNHPYIVSIHDRGTAAGCDYFVMDYVSGQPLDVYMASGERTIDESLRLFQNICDAINAAHLRGVIHRDIKPSNIRIDAEGRPHILDFGLAKMGSAGVPPASGSVGAGAPSLPGVGDGTAGSAGVPPASGSVGVPPAFPKTMTITGQFIGSLPWASPEQAEAIPSKIDIRTDVYSLGVVLYQMLTGKFPYEVVGNMRDVLGRIIGEAPQRPRAVRREINDEVETIILKCLAKDPDRRYQSAGELAKDVERYLAGEPIEAKRDSAAYVLRKHLRKHKLPVAIAAAFLIVVFAGLAASLTFWQRAVHERDAAQAARLAETEQRTRAERNFQTARDAVDRMLTRVAEEELPEVPQMEPIRRALLEDALEFYQRFLAEAGNDRSVQYETAKAHKRVAQILRSLGQVEASKRAYQESISLLGRLTREIPDNSEYRATLTDAYFNLATMLARSERLPEAEQTFQRGIDFLEQFSTEFPELRPGLRDSLSSLHNNLAILYGMTGRMDEAEQSFRHCLALQEELSADAPGEPGYCKAIATTLGNLGIVYGQTDRPEEAEQVYRQALEVQRRLVADFPDMPAYRGDLARSALNFGETLRSRRRFEEAEPILAEAAELLGKLVAEVPTQTDYRVNLGAAHQILGLVYTETDRPEDAENAFRTTIGVCDSLQAEFPDMPECRALQARTYQSLGILFQMLGRAEQAEPPSRTALELWQALTAKNPDVPDYLKNVAVSSAALGLSLTVMDRTDEAAAAFEQTRQALEELVEQFPDEDEYHDRLACFLSTCPAARFRDPDRALAHARRAVQLAPESGDAWQSLGVAHYRGENWRDAVAALNRLGELCSDCDSRKDFFLAMSYHRQGDLEQARHRYRSAVETMEQRSPRDFAVLRIREEAAEQLGIED